MSSLDMHTASSMEKTPSSMDWADTPAPASYMAWSIFNCLCCFWPVGIAAIIYSSMVNNANLAGDLTKAESASRTTKILNVVALVCGLVLIIVFIMSREFV